MIVFPIRLLTGTFRRMTKRYILRDFSPVVLFLGAGTLLLVGGGIWGVAAWMESTATGVPASTGSVMLAVLPLLAGFQLVLQGIVLDINGSPR